RHRAAPPGRPRAVERTVLRRRDFPPGIAVGGMQPAAAEVDRKCRAFAGRPGPPAQARPRLDHETVDTGIHEPPAGGDPGCTAADNHHFGIAGHETPATIRWESESFASIVQPTTDRPRSPSRLADFGGEHWPLAAGTSVLPALFAARQL